MQFEACEEYQTADKVPARVCESGCCCTRSEAAEASSRRRPLPLPAQCSPGCHEPLQPDLPAHPHVSLPIASTTRTRLVFTLDSNRVSTYVDQIFVKWDSRSPWYQSQHTCNASQLACNNSGRLWLGRSEVGRQGLLTCSRGKPRGSRDAR